VLSFVFISISCLLDDRLAFQPLFAVHAAWPFAPIAETVKILAGRPGNGTGGKVKTDSTQMTKNRTDSGNMITPYLIVNSFLVAIGMTGISWST
jgi:hypothetical protein